MRSFKHLRILLMNDGELMILSVGPLPLLSWGCKKNTMSREPHENKRTASVYRSLGEIT
jgi:hypothetical protein